MCKKDQAQSALDELKQTVKLGNRHLCCPGARAFYACGQAQA